MTNTKTVISLPTHDEGALSIVSHDEGYTVVKFDCAGVSEYGYVCESLEQAQNIFEREARKICP